jgi:WS/DGAT/MGAT family acyltransferase
MEGVPGKTLLLQMTHHAMIDGASGVELTTILYDFEADATEPPPPVDPWQPVPVLSPAELVTEALRENLNNFSKTNPLNALTNTAARWQKLNKATEIMSRFVTRPAITAPFNSGQVGPRRRVRWLKRPFGEIREIRRQLGGTINDVVLTTVSEAIARYLQQNNERVDNQFLRIMCPVNVRTEDKKGGLGNQVSAIYPMLPAWPMDCSERLQVVVKETQRIKQDEEAQALTVLQESMPLLPPLSMATTSQLVGTAMDPTALAARMPLPIAPNVGYRPPNNGVNFTCTNVPGVQVPQFMCGSEVTDTIGLLVLTGNTGFSATILSYNKQLFFSFICEPRLLPDLDVIADGANSVFQELLDAARAKDALAMESAEA